MLFSSKVMVRFIKLSVWLVLQTLSWCQTSDKIVRYCRTIFVVQRSCPTNHVTHA